MYKRQGYNDRQIVKAVQEGRLDEAVLDEAVERVLNVVFADVYKRQVWSSGKIMRKSTV